MQKLDYYILDVFSDERYKGNPLAVVVLNEELEPFQFKNIAREFGYSETSFVKYTAEDDALSIRSFTPAGIEVGGAGHNLLGAVSLTLLKGWGIFNKQHQEQYVLMMNQRIDVVISYTETGLPFVTMKQQSAVMLKKVPVEIIAEAIGLAPYAFSINGWEPIIVKTEVAHLMVPVKDTEALNKVRVNKKLLNEASAHFGFEGCYLFAVNFAEDEYIAETRFFNPGIGIDEDAATGSAAGPLAGYLLNKGYIKTGKDYKILQGVQMEQPSTIHVKITSDRIWISGTSVIVMEGQLYV